MRKFIIYDVIILSAKQQTQINILFLKTKTKMSKIGRMIWKMKVTEAFYTEIIEETKAELKALNQDHLVNWEEKNNQVG